MKATLWIKGEKFGTTGNTLIFLNILLLVASLILAAYYYSKLPQTVLVPTRFDIHGQPEAWGDKSTLLILPICQAAVVLLLLLLTRFRFALLNKYPYLVNLPAFAMMLGSKDFPEKKKSEFINNLFLIVLVMCLLVNIGFLGLDWAIFPSLAEGKLAFTFINLFVPWIPLIIVIPFVILYYKRLYNEIRKIAEG